MSLARSLLATLAVAAVTSARAQETGPAATAFQHADQAPWWLSGQANAITQAHPPFSASYSGFGTGAQVATSYVATVFSGLQLAPLTEVILHVESSAGNGLSDALGLFALRAHLEL